MGERGKDRRGKKRKREVELRVRAVTRQQRQSGERQDGSHDMHCQGRV